MGQKQAKLPKKIEKGFIFLICCSPEGKCDKMKKKKIIKGIEKDMKRNNFVFEDFYTSLNYGKDAQEFYTKTENREIIFWFEENSLLKGVKKSILENIEKGKDVILTGDCSNMSEIQEFLYQETVGKFLNSQILNFF